MFADADADANVDIDVDVDVDTGFVLLKTLSFVSQTWESIHIHQRSNRFIFELGVKKNGKSFIDRSSESIRLLAHCHIRIIPPHGMLRLHWARNHHSGPQSSQQSAKSRGGDREEHHG